MTTIDERREAWSKRLRRAGGELGFDVAIADVRLGDEEVARLIDADGRTLLALGRAPKIERYQAALPDLAALPVALDAAIDMTLRGMAAGGRPSRETVEVLCTRHPSYASAIRDAAAIASVMWSSGMIGPRREPAAEFLPRRIGPTLADGAGRYELVERLGGGSGGVVYRASDRLLADEDGAAPVAVKLLQATGSAGAALRLDEARKARRVEHEAVVRVFDCGLAVDGRPLAAEDEVFIASELVAGGTLETLVDERGGRLPAREAAALVARIAEGVHAAHLAGLVHCDIKPANVLLTSAGRPKLADFGTAVRDDDAHRAELRGGAAAQSGTLAFMAPEQYRMEVGAVDPPVDLFALGGLLYWLVAGRLPSGASPEEIALTHDAARGRTEGPSLRRMAGVDTDLDAICRRALDPDPARRHPSAMHFAEDLEAWRARRTIAWTRPSPARVVALWSLRHPVAGSLTAALLVVLIVSGVLLARQARALWQEKREWTAKREFYSSFTDGLEQLGAMGFWAQQLWPLVYVEGIVGSRFLDDPELTVRIWKRREEVTRQRLAQIDAIWGRDTAESAMLYVQLAMDEYRRTGTLAAETVASARAACRAVLPDDPFSDTAELLAACVEMREAVAALPPDPDDARRREIDAIAGRLETGLTTVSKLGNRAALGLIVIDHLLLAYTPGALDDQAASARLRQEATLLWRSAPHAEDLPARYVGPVRDEAAATVRPASAAGPRGPR